MEIQTKNAKSYSLFALNIVKAEGRKIFESNRALSLLSRSESFFKELLNTFNGLFYLDITPEKFCETVSNLQISATDKTRLDLISKLYLSYVGIMNQNGFVLPFSAVDLKPERCSKNPDIQKRQEFLKSVFEEKKSKDFDFKKSENIEYLEFSDVHQESMYIVKQIKTLIESGRANYSEIAVFADKTETRDKISDILKTQNVPVVSSIYNEDYENLKHKINVCEKISKICYELKMQGFSYDDFKDITLESRAHTEICKEELDECIKDLLSEVLTDSYAVEKIVNAKETPSSLKSKKSLLDAIHTSWHILKEEDAKLLGSEFGMIKTFYSFYKEKQYAKAVDTIIKRFFSLFENTPVKEVVAGKIKSLNELQNLYDNILKSEPDFESFKDIMRWLPKDTAKDKNAVHLSSVSTNLKPEKTFKYIFVAGLTENNFPGNNPYYPFIAQQTDEILTLELRKINSHFKSFLKTDEIYFNTRFNALCDVISRAEEKITFAFHAYEAKKPALPSVFFKVLNDYDSQNFEKVVMETTFEQKPLTMSETVCEKNVAEKIITDTDVLKLNSSAISTFQKCPRKYYYKNLLNLKEPYTFAASYGTVVHAVFEVLNRKFLDRYNKETAQELANVLFESGVNPENSLKAGFKETDIELIKAADELSLAEMKDNFQDALEDFSLSGGFDNPPRSAVCEKSFTFKLDEIPNVVFEGRIDAILTDGDGSVRIIDYKTGKDKTNTLEYAVSEYGVNFKSRTGKDPSNIETLQNAYDYQIPLYYLACQNSHDLVEFKDKVSSLGLIYIRPKSKDNGCSEDFVSAEKIEFYKAKIIQNLKETVIEKIVNETEFKMNKTFACDSCAYKFLCGGGNDDE